MKFIVGRDEDALDEAQFIEADDAPSAAMTFGAKLRNERATLVAGRQAKPSRVIRTITHRAGPYVVINTETGEKTVHRAVYEYTPVLPPPVPPLSEWEWKHEPYKDEEDIDPDDYDDEDEEEEPEDEE